MEPLIGCPRYRGVLQHGFRLKHLPLIAAW